MKQKPRPTITTKTEEVRLKEGELFFFPTKINQPTEKAVDRHDNNPTWHGLSKKKYGPLATPLGVLGIWGQPHILYRPIRTWRAMWQHHVIHLDFSGPFLTTIWAGLTWKCRSCFQIHLDEEMNKWPPDLQVSVLATALPQLLGTTEHFHN